MSDADAFADFVRRIRAGDEQAAAELVRRYEPLIRREVRHHLDDYRLGRLLDSMDVCQSVMLSFFARSARGQYDLESPGQLVKLLVTIARNKLASAARREHRVCRDCRRAADDGPDQLRRLAADGPEPGESVATKELLERARRSLSEAERQVAELRGQGLAWADVAARLGGTAQSRRMQLARAVDRVARELGLDEPGGQAGLVTGVTAR